MSKIGKVKSYRLPVKETRPLSNKLKCIINAGSAAAGPPLGPQLGKYGINIAAFCKDFNNKTSNYVKGIPLPCVITVNPDRSYNIGLKAPTLSYYLMQAAGITNFHKYNGISGKTTLKHIYEIAKIKHSDPLSYYQLKELPEIVKMVVNYARNVGVEIVKDFDPKEYEQFLSEKAEYIKKLEEKLAAEKEAKLLRG